MVTLILSVIGIVWVVILVKELDKLEDKYLELASRLDTSDSMLNQHKAYDFDQWHKLQKELAALTLATKDQLEYDNESIVHLQEHVQKLNEVSQEYLEAYIEAANRLKKAKKKRK